MAADFIESLAAHPRELAFIKAVPADWAQSHLVAGEVGDYAIFARKDRNSDDWYVGGVNDARVSRLFQAEHKLFFKPTENEMREHAQLLHNAISNVSVPDWATRLASLQIGECWSLGRSLNETTGRLVFQAQRIKITALEERGFNA